MGRDRDIDLLAKTLCFSMLRDEPDDHSRPWDDLHEHGRDWYRNRIRDLLAQEELLIRLVLYRSRDDGTEVAAGGEPGANAGASE